MKNFEKFKTTRERFDEFFKVCASSRCDLCKLSGNNRHGSSAECALAWLDLEAETEDDNPMPCPFCEGECSINTSQGRVCIECDNLICLYFSGSYSTKSDAIAAHNRMCKAVAAYKEGEVK